MFGWYVDLSKQEKRTFWACFSGWSLDAMDAQLFSFMIPALMLTWHLSKTDAGYLGTASLVATAIGGWLCGILADRVGRLRVLQFTVLWFAVFSGLAGFAQSFDQLLVLRFLQGLGFGGEWAAGAVLMGEIIRPEHRGKAVGCIQSGYGVGWTLATLIATAAFWLFPQTMAWRALFWFSVTPAFLLVFIRRKLQEPEIFKKTRALEQQAGKSAPGFFAIFHPDILRTTMLSSLLALGVIGAGSAVIPWLPTYMKIARHLSGGGVGIYMTTVTVGSFFGFVGSAYMTDLIGRRRNFLLASICSWLVMLAYLFLPLNNTALLLLSFPVGFCLGATYSTLGPYFTELFPTAIRGAGQAFAYNFGKGIGAFCVVLVGMIAEHMPLGQAIGIFSLAGYSLAIVATLLLPETRGITLVSGDAPPTRAAPSITTNTSSPSRSA